MEELKKLQLDDLSQFTIKGSETEWSSALSKNPKGIVSLKRYYFIYVMSEYVVNSFLCIQVARKGDSSMLTRRK